MTTNRALTASAAVGFAVVLAGCGTSVGSSTTDGLQPRAAATDVKPINAKAAAMLESWKLPSPDYDGTIHYMPGTDSDPAPTSAVTEVSREQVAAILKDRGAKDPGAMPGTPDIVLRVTNASDDGSARPGLTWVATYHHSPAFNYGPPNQPQQDRDDISAQDCDLVLMIDATTSAQRAMIQLCTLGPVGRAMVAGGKDMPPQWTLTPK